jgi:hypothetical protein
MVYLFGPRERVGDAFSKHIDLLEKGREQAVLRANQDTAPLVPYDALCQIL